jgi:hypothetical protein
VSEPNKHGIRVADQLLSLSEPPTDRLGYQRIMLMDPKISRVFPYHRGHRSLRRRSGDKTGRTASRANTPSVVHWDRVWDELAAWNELTRDISRWPGTGLEQPRINALEARVGDLEARVVALEATRTRLIEPQLHTPSELAEALGYTTPWVIQEACRRKQIRARQVRRGNKEFWLIPHEEFERVLRSGRFFRSA